MEKQRGFTLPELVVSIGLFMLISAEAFTLVGRQQTLFRQQQDLTAINVSLRNAASQIQLEGTNAGAGIFTGANIPDWPVGITIVNTSPGTSCYTGSTHTYGANCFDTLNVIMADPNTPPLHPQASPSGCVATTATSAYVPIATGLTAAQTAALFKTGDQLMFLKSDGSQVGTTVLTANGLVSGTLIKLQHNATNADGTNTTANDPISISTHLNTKLGVTFCSTDWLLRLTPITYSVDSSVSTNPKLVRTQAGVTSVISQQIIGFRVGATLWNGTTVNGSYNYTASTYSNPYDFSLVRSIRVSVIGRTTPNSNPEYYFRNTFDGGAYQVQGISAVISPRNLSMRD